MSLFEGAIESNHLPVAGNLGRFGGRWRFVGAGLSNVWRYGDLELPAHSGRLLLRGPNGTGKTTALEALWPYLLDLNARKMSAGKARTTSLTSLMRDGADSKLRVGYMWMTYAAPDTNDVVSYGVRISYSSGTASTKAMPFFVHGRPLHELALYESKRATLSTEAFNSAVAAAGGIFFDSDEDYIRDLATRVFHSEPVELEMLATRIRAVRDPTLLGEVSPAQAANALRASLPGVDPQVIADTADALAESDTTREAFERDRDAAIKLDDFARVWAGHVVDVANSAHGRANEAANTLRTLTIKRDRLANAHRRATDELHAAQTAHGELADLADEKAAEVATLKNSELFKQGAELTELKNTAAAQAGMAEAEFEALRTSANRLTSNGHSLRRQLEELADDVGVVLAQARTADPAATAGGVTVAWDQQPRPMRNVAGVAVDVGPAIVLHADLEAVAASSAAWEALASSHLARAQGAKLKLTEHNTKILPLDEKARIAASRAEELHRAADSREGEARNARGTAARTGTALVRSVMDWSATASVLGGVVDDGFEDVATNEPAQILAAVIEAHGVAADAAKVLVLRHEMDAEHLDSEASLLESAAEDARRKAAELRAGQVLALPRPIWAGSGNDDIALGTALEWNADVAEDRHGPIEAALSASGALGATLQAAGSVLAATTQAWTVGAAGADAHPNLTAIVHVAADHPQHDAINSILAKIALLPTADGADGASLIIGEDGSFRAGVLHGDTAQLEQTTDRFIGERQRRAAALRQADRLDQTATANDADARDLRTAADRERGASTSITALIAAFPSVEQLRTHEARRSLATEAAHEAEQEFNDARDIAQTLAEQAREAFRVWRDEVAAMGLPIEPSELAKIRDNGNRIANDLAGAVKRLTGPLASRMRRLIDDVAADVTEAETLASLEVSARKSQAVWAATNQSVRTIESNLGASIAEIENAFRVASAELGELEKQVTLAEKRQTTAFGESSSLEGQVRVAGDAVADARPAVDTSRDALRALLAVPGVGDVLFAAQTEPADIPDAELLAAVATATGGKATNAKRTVREREDIARAALAGIWSLDPGDDHPELESYVLTHRDIAYTPISAHKHAAELATRAEAALKEAEASALRDFVIGKLPKAISRGWETMMDWRREVNDKMRNARASSGVSVQVKLSVRSDLSAHARTVYELLCKTADGQRLPEARAQVGAALQSLIAGAEGDDMHARVENAVNIADWVDVSYEVTREGKPPTVWGSRTGLSGGERRLVVLAPMLAAVAAAYDRISTRGLRLAALDEVPAEVDERGREGLARYIAELDLDLVCTSYLWDGAPGAWDGVDAHDLEADEHGTVVAFPMLVRGLTPLPGDTFEQPSPNGHNGTGA